MTASPMPDDRRPTRLGGFLAGLGALVALWPIPQPPRYPHRDEGEALRGDGARIGADMRRVIERAHAQAAPE